MKYFFLLSVLLCSCFGAPMVVQYKLFGQEVCHLASNPNHTIIKFKEIIQKKLGEKYKYFVFGGRDIDEFDSIEQLNDAQTKTQIPVVIAESKYDYHTQIELTMFGQKELVAKPFVGFETIDDFVTSYRATLRAKDLYFAYRGRDINVQFQSLQDLKTAQMRTNSPVVVAASKEEYDSKIEVRRFGETLFTLIPFNTYGTIDHLKAAIRTQLNVPYEHFSLGGQEISKYLTVKLLKIAQAEKNIPVVVAANQKAFDTHIEVRKDGETELEFIPFPDGSRISDLKAIFSSRPGHDGSNLVFEHQGKYLMPRAYLATVKTSQTKTDSPLVCRKEKIKTEKY